MLRRLLSLFAVSLSALLFSNCAVSSGPSSALSSGYGANGGAADRSVTKVACETPRDRPGLGTVWDKRLDDKVGTTIFDRDSGKPVAIAKVFYNDQAGAAAMAGRDWSYSTSFRDYAGGIFRAGLRNHRGAALSAYQSSDNLICIGEAGERYSIELENLSNNRLEFVVTVDGLDVLTGRPGSFSNRGYILNPGERHEIRGWRTSDKEVAAFKFGPVSETYASKTTGGTQNVGVIGAAVFAERGTSPRPYAGTDSNRRLQADPFVATPEGSRFAQPPPR